MARYVTSVSSSLSPDEAFAFMADVRRFTEWDPGVVCAVQVAGTGPGPGAAYDLTVKAGGTSTMRYEVTVYAPPRRLFLVARTARLVSEDEVRVEPGPGGVGSVVTYDARLTLTGWLRVFDFALAIAFKRLGDRAAAGLRAALGRR